MKYLNSLLPSIVLLCIVCACNSETKKVEAIDPVEFEKAFKEYMILDYSFVDTMIKYELLENEILLDFGNPEDNRWSIAVIFTNPDGSDKATTKIGLSYYLENGKIRLPYPEGIKSKKDAMHFFVCASPTGKSNISEYPQLSPKVDLFFYRQVSKGILKPTGDEYYQMKNIIHKVNWLTDGKYSIEMREALSKKEMQMLNRVRKKYR